MDNKVEIEDIRARVRGDIPAMKQWRVLYIEDCTLLLTAYDSLQLEVDRLKGDADQATLDFAVEVNSLRVELEETQRQRDRFGVLITRQIAELTSLAARLAKKDATIEAGSLLLEAAREEIKHLQQMVEYKDGAFAGAVELAEIYKRERDENEKALTAAHSNALSEAIEKVKGLSVMDVSAVPGRPRGPQEFKDNATAALEQLKQESSHANK